MVTDHKGGFLANAALASRKDARDAVTAARKAFAGWSAATACNRGQVLYRVAELLEGRRVQFAAEGRSRRGARRAAGGGGRRRGHRPLGLVRRVGDKLAQVRGAANPVAGPYFNFSLPEPTGVVAVIAPQASSLLGFVSVVAPAVVSGNTVVALASLQRRLGLLGAEGRPGHGSRHSYLNPRHRLRRACSSAAPACLRTSSARYYASGSVVAGAIFTLPALYTLHLDPHPVQTIFIAYWPVPTASRIQYMSLRYGTLPGTAPPMQVVEDVGTQTGELAELER